MAALLTESPYANDQEREVVRHCQMAFTNERTSISTFADLAPTHYWRHSYDPDLHRTNGQADPECPAHDVVFVGTGFEERCELLSAVDWTGLGIDLGLYGAWEMIGSRSRLRKFIRGGIVDNRLAAALYRKATIGLNLHRTSIGFGRGVPHVAGAESMNPRDLELAACGTFALADHREELREVFGTAVPTFSGPAELADQVRYWLQPERTAQRQECARAAAEAARACTFDVQASRILSLLDHARRVQGESNG
jgi:glycosyltransferase involved in cell wall biosynthesis